MGVQRHELALDLAIALFDCEPALAQEVVGLAGLHVARRDPLHVPAGGATSVVVPQLDLDMTYCKVRVCGVVLYKG